MVNTNTIAILLCLTAATVSQQSYQLVWSDEFNGNTLDRSKWQHEVTCSPQNHEHQCYTTSEKNVAVRNGSLFITAQIENGGNNKKYSSGRINTKHSFAWKYGKFEARARLPEGQYLWPALWMLPRDYVYGGWPTSGEIDIMENRGGQNREHSSALHFGSSWPNNRYESNRRTVAADLTKDFHTYGAIWTDKSIQFMLDGQVWHTISLQKMFNNPGAKSYTKNGQPFDQPFFFLINLAVGGDFFGGNSGAITTNIARSWPNNKFEIDYVRVYQLKDGVVAPPVPAPAPVPAPSTSTPAPTVSSTTCQNMFNGLKCRTTTRDVAALDAARVKAARDWLCTGHPEYCEEISGSGKFVGCNRLEQLSYAMNGYYSEYSGSQGQGACNFNGLGKLYSTSSTKQSTATPTSTVSNCPAGQQSCEDVLFGTTCYTPAGPFACVVGDDNKSHLCPKGLSACGKTCYPASQYNCVAGWLQRK